MGNNCEQQQADVVGEFGAVMGAYMTNEKDSVLTIDELSEYLKISKSTLYKLVQEGKVPGQKVGRHWRFSRRAIDNWIAEKPEPRQK
jgi:excisionase family DNA binding protein